MNPFKSVIDKWQAKALEAEETTEVSITLKTADLVKIRAFAEVYGLPESEITVSLLEAAIKEAERAMPYVQGDTVIRVEDGEEIFDDAGKTPAYVEAERRLSK